MVSARSEVEAGWEGSRLPRVSFLQGAALAVAAGQNAEYRRRRHGGGGRPAESAYLMSLASMLMEATSLTMHPILRSVFCRRLRSSVVLPAVWRGR
jgi:hypothetical protein